MEMNLALAELVAAMAEEQRNNKDRAANDMRSAQALYRSLGWRDYSEETLRVIARRELEKWTHNSHGSGDAK